MNGLYYFFKILFLVILVSSFLSFLLVLITLWRQQTHFKTTLYRMRNAQEHLIENYSPSLYYVSKAPLFLGTQVSTTFVGFYLVLGVLSIAGVGLVFVFLFFAGNIEKSLQTSVQLILPAALSILLKYFLEKKIARAKLSNGFIITHPSKLPRVPRQPRVISSRLPPHSMQVQAAVLPHVFFMLLYM